MKGILLHTMCHLLNRSRTFVTFRLSSMQAFMSRSEMHFLIPFASQHSPMKYNDFMELADYKSARAEKEAFVTQVLTTTTEYSYRFHTSCRNDRAIQVFNVFLSAFASWRETFPVKKTFQCNVSTEGVQKAFCNILSSFDRLRDRAHFGHQLITHHPSLITHYPLLITHHP